MSAILELLEELDQYKNPSNAFLLNLFKQLRNSKLIRSEIVLKYGPSLINSISDDAEGKSH